GNNVGNGLCNAIVNTAECGWDGGDCCECTCDDGVSERNILRRLSRPDSGWSHYLPMKPPDVEASVAIIFDGGAEKPPLAVGSEGTREHPHSA
ncbi:unnamed protein product, partial [Pylaiella littoralis]